MLSMTDIAPSSSSQRRLRRWLILLGALALPLLLITLWTPAYASGNISRADKTDNHDRTARVVPEGSAAPAAQCPVPRAAAGR
jgi:hypothetical protein